MLEIIGLLVIGIGTGVLSGLLGIGGGMITVPALMVILKLHPLFAQADTMHIAACTSLSIAVLTTLSTAIAYGRRQALVWPIFWRITPAIGVGLLSGTSISHLLTNQTLIHLFAVFLTIMAIHLFLDSTRSSPSAALAHKLKQENFSGYQFALLIGGGFIVGNLSALFGIGGGILLVPLFLQLYCNMHQASGTSALCGVVSTLLGAVLLSYLPQPLSKLPHIIGNIYWPATLLIGISSVSCAPLGAKLAFILPPSVLKKLFSVLLLISAWGLF